MWRFLKGQQKLFGLFNTLWEHQHALKAILDPGTFARDFGFKQETGSLDDIQGELFLFCLFHPEMYANQQKTGKDDSFCPCWLRFWPVKHMTSNQLFFSYVCNYSTCACFFIRLLKIFAEWKNISFTIQDAIFEEDENERITTYMMSR